MTDEIKEPTFAEQIEAMADGSGGGIVGCVIGPFGWSSDIDEKEPYKEDDIERADPVKRGVLLSWEEARPMLDYVYDTGYGAPECDAIWVWTEEIVIFVSQYDGATGLESVPRNPIDGIPEMPGG